MTEKNLSKNPDQKQKPVPTDDTYRPHCTQCDELMEPCINAGEKRITAYLCVACGYSCSPLVMM